MRRANSAAQNLQLVAPLALVLMAWPLCRTPLARRFAIVLPLGFFLFLGNPWLTNIVAEITTPAIHWRILWLLPVPLLAGLMFSSVLEPGRPLQQFARVPLFALALALFFMHVSPRTTLARASLAWPPHPKVDMSAYRVALALIHAVPPHRQVLATLAVSRVLPMLNGYSHPLFIKPTYLPPDDEDRKWRQRLTAVVSRDRSRGVSEPWLIASLDHYHVEGIAMRRQRSDNGPVPRALRSASFHKVAESDGHEIWTRSR